MSNAWVAGESPEHGNHDRRETRWLTPPTLVESIGSFDLDPCGAPGHELASRTYLPENGEDGLTLPWKGRVWLNPPYGRQQGPFLKRMAQHGSGVALLFARTETVVFQDLVWARADSILFLRGRLNFLRADLSRASANAGAPSCLVAYSAEDTVALEASGQPGHLVRLDPLI